MMKYHLSDSINYKNTILFLLPVLLWQLFQYRGFPVIILKMVGFLSTSILISLTFNALFLRKYRWGSIPAIIQIIFACVLISMITSYIYWNQELVSSFRGSTHYFNLAFFFFLLQGKYEGNIIIKLTIFYALFIIILWAIGLSQAPNIIFGHLGDEGDIQYSINRGISRISIIGKNIIVLFYLFILNHILESRQRRLSMIVLAIILFTISCADLTRFKILSITIVTVIYIFRRSKYRFVALFVTAVSSFAIVAMVQYWFSDILNALIALSNEQFDDSLGFYEANGILYRIKEYSFFLGDFHNNYITILFGNGAENHSALSLYYNRLRDQGYYLSDVSYAKFFTEIGLVGLLVYLFLFYKALSSKVTAKYQFAVFYILYVVICNITIPSAFDSVTLSIALYLLYIGKEQKLCIRNKKTKNGI